MELIIKVPEPKKLKTSSLFSRIDLVDAIDPMPMLADRLDRFIKRCNETYTTQYLMERNRIIETHPSNPDGRYIVLHVDITTSVKHPANDQLFIGQLEIITDMKEHRLGEMARLKEIAHPIVAPKTVILKRDANRACLYLHAPRTDIYSHYGVVWSNRILSRPLNPVKNRLSDICRIYDNIFTAVALNYIKTSPYPSVKIDTMLRRMLLTYNKHGTYFKITRTNRPYLTHKLSSLMDWFAEYDEDLIPLAEQVKSELGVTT